MSRLASALAFALVLAPLAAQAPTANDVGLQMSGAATTVIYGQMCGAVTCTPMTGGTVTPGSTRTVTTHGAPGTPYILAIGLPGVCFPFPGIANLLLLNGPEVLSVGATVNGPSISTCRVGPGRYSLSVPLGVPTGWTFRLQALANTYTSVTAFTPALEVNL